MLESSEMSQRELAIRLEVSEARISQLLSGGENVTLETVADLGWALGVRFALVPIPFDDRSGTPASADPPPPRWLASLRRRIASRKEAQGPPPSPERLPREVAVN